MVQVGTLIDTADDAARTRALWFLRLFPELCGEEVAQLTLSVGPAGGWVGLWMELPHALDPSDTTRLQFWCARAGGAWVDFKDEAALRTRLVRAESRSVLAPRDLPARVLQVAGQLGISPSDPLLLAGRVLELGPRGVSGLTISNVSAAGFFIQSPQVLPVGTEFSLSLPPPAPEALRNVEVKVAHVRRTSSAERPMGFGVVPTEPSPALLEALARHDVVEQTSPAASNRVHPRFPLVARLRYQDEGQFSDDYVSNLSFGGAFVTTSSPGEKDSTLVLEIELPSGILMSVESRVVFATATGMGLQFKPDEATERVLNAELSRIACRPRRVLVVEDEPSWRQLLERQLRKLGLDVLLASNGREGLVLLMDELLNVDLVILDSNMPEMDGAELVSLVRVTGGETELPMVVVTADEDPVTAPRLMDVGADAVLSKLLKVEMLVEEALRVATAKRLRLAGHAPT
jgi:CheY-like chemotaxis protein